MNVDGEKISNQASTVDIPVFAMRYLSTKQLIGLQWAIGRLPVGIFSGATVGNIRQELTHRSLFSKTPDQLDTKERISVKDAFLYVKTLTDSHALKEHDLDSMKEKVCTALVNHCELLVNPSSSYFSSSFILNNHQLSSACPQGASSSSCSTNATNKKLSPIEESIIKITPYERENYVMKLSILIDSVQAFIELGWFSHEMYQLCSKFLIQIHQMTTQSTNAASSVAETTNNLRTKCAIEFQRGVLDELLKVYQQLPYMKSAKNSKRGKFMGVNNFFSKFFSSSSSSSSSS